MSILDSLDPKIIGKRLRSARLAAGMTQEAAASQIGLARTTLVAVEKGLRSVRDEELVNLSKLYQVSASSLLKASMPTSEALIRYRKDPRINKRTDSQNAVELLLELSNAAYELEKELGELRPQIFNFSYPIQKRDIRTQAEDAAMSLRQHLGIGLASVVSLNSLVEIELGMRVFSRPIQSQISGVYIHDERLGNCILLNSQHYITRRNFTLVHELGHAISKPDYIDIMDQDHSDSTLEERFANQFACIFLMPPRTVRKQFDVYKSKGTFSGHNLLAMASSFQVSPKAMCLWLEELGLLKQGTYDSISERGFSSSPKKLSPEEQLGLYLPTRTSLLAADALLAGVYSEGQLMKMFKLDRLELREILAQMKYEGAMDE